MQSGYVFWCILPDSGGGLAVWLCVCMCVAMFGEGVGVMVFDLLWRLEQQDSAESRLAQQARREWHFLSLSRPAESPDSRDLVLSRVHVHHHQNQPPTVGGGVGGYSVICVTPLSLPHPPHLHPPPPALSLALLQRDQTAALSLSAPWLFLFLRADK